MTKKKTTEVSETLESLVTPSQTEANEEAKKPRPKAAIDIGAIVASRISRDVPIFKDKDEARDLHWWIECPAFEVPVETEVDERRDYIFPISIYSESYQGALSLLDFMIEKGKTEIEGCGVRICLNAVQHAAKRVIGKKLYKVELQYFFRMKKIPESIEEVK